MDNPILEMKKWYYQTWFIAILTAIGAIGSIFIIGIPILIVAIIVIVKKSLLEKKISTIDYADYINCKELMKNLQALKDEIENKEKIKTDIINAAKEEALIQVEEDLKMKNEKLLELDSKIENRNNIFDKYFEEAKTNADIETKKLLDEQYKLRSDLEVTKVEYDKISKSLKTQQNKLDRIKILYRAIESCLKRYDFTDLTIKDIFLDSDDDQALQDLSPTVELKIHSMDVKELRKLYKENEKAITKTLEKYSDRYTTKANKAIYKLMVIALRAELQNILYNLKYDLLDKSIENVKLITSKYAKIASDGNQSIAPTLAKFIGEIEHLFVDDVKIEYEYYIKREREKAEQAAIREQMRQEAAERKELERQKAQVEAEEKKYLQEMDKLKSQLDLEKDTNTISVLNKRIEELQNQLNSVEEKKEDIINRQNGKAGNVYVISNIGSFGENVFKIGMTRRLDPNDRIRELGSASVPFQFDVHSFIFSDDAVSLENKLHTLLDDRRVNKVNLRKEFFRVSIDELENLVNEIDPTAEFNKTILAEEYRQTLDLSKTA
ncbi:GIY-YIG nuclease family protein [Eubacterium maltosivorans]|uniref:GIY-YIG nuclease family protein n=1 Tax=Eubacterium maltosivorans TaxID=2041044 RepID=UPI001A9C0EF6|nr:GIY-YIG nuclease family protein [Eubacterium maltosivorans]